MSSASGGISFTGLGSGVDWQSIVSQLVAVERAPVTVLQQKQAREQYKQQTLTGITSGINSLNAAADALRTGTAWSGTPTGSSGESGSYSIQATSSALKANYQIQVTNLAKSEAWTQTNTSGTMGTGSLWAGSGTAADSTALLSTLTDSSGASLGLAAGQTITLNATQGVSGSPVTGSFTVQANSTVADLRSFVQTTIPHSTVQVVSGGRLQITDPAGTDGELKTFSLSGPGGSFLTGTPVGAAATGIGSIQANDTLQIAVGSGYSFNVNVTAGMAMTDVAAAINRANGGAAASVVGGALRIGARETGAANTIAVTSTGATAAALGLTKTQNGADGTVIVDGKTYTTASNSTTSILAGATLNLLATSVNATTGSTDPAYVDPNAIQTSIQSFITQYNGMMDQFNTLTNEKSVQSPTTQTDFNKGAFFADPTLTSMRDQLQEAMQSVVNGLAAGSNLASSIGISTGAIGTGVNSDTFSGKLQFDTAAFQAAWAKDPNSIKNLLSASGGTTATNGLAQRIFDLSKNWTQVGGLLPALTDGSNDTLKTLQDQIDTMNARADAVGERLKTQFIAMDTAVSKLKQAQSSLPTSSTTGG